VVFVSGSSKFSSCSGVCSLSEFLLLLEANQDVEKLVCPRFIAQLNQTLLATTLGHINIKTLIKMKLNCLYKKALRMGRPSAKDAKVEMLTKG